MWGINVINEIYRLCRYMYEINVGCVDICGGLMRLMRCRLCRYMWGLMRLVRCRLCRYMWGINEIK